MQVLGSVVHQIKEGRLRRLLIPWSFLVLGLHLPGSAAGRHARSCLHPDGAGSRSTK
jgi:hypothetical protein